MTLREEVLGPEDAEDVHGLYASYEWWADRDVADVRTALENTDLAVGCRDAETDELVAAARVLTDFVYYAKLYDVIVAERRRGDGVGAMLVEAVRDREELRGVDVVMLNCREGLVPFYESCGFERHGMTVGSGEHEGESLVKMVADGAAAD